MKIHILQGDVLYGLRTLPDGCVQCCITSPPYYGLRNYGVDGQIGLEETPGAFVAKMVEVFREVKRVLRDDGTLWLNLGDSYAGSNCGSNDRREDGASISANGNKYTGQKPGLAIGYKAKDMMGMPWRVAFALQADGWYLRSDIIWSKPNPMPESVTDRPTKAHEYIFLLTKSARYFYDADAIRYWRNARSRRLQRRSPKGCRIRTRN
jgi:DNA modification methylase